MKQTQNEHTLYSQPAAFIYDFPLMCMWFTILCSPITEEALPFRVLLSRRNRRKSPIPAAHSGSPQDNLTDWGQGALTQAFAGALGSCPPPRPVFEERQTLFTVYPVSIMFAITHQLVKFILHTLTCMPVAFTPGKRTDTQKCETATRSQKWMLKNDVQRELNTTPEWFCF